LAPTIGPSGNAYVRLSDADPVEVESLEAIGIYSTRRATERQQQSPTPQPVRVATAGVIDLEDLLTEDCRAILEGTDTEGDRSASLTKLIKEAAGWANWCGSQGFGVGGSAEALAAEAGEALGIDGDRVDRILKTVALASCQPAAQIRGGDESCWKKVKRLDRATWQQFGPKQPAPQLQAEAFSSADPDAKPSKLAANIRRFGAVFGDRLRFNQITGFYEFDGKQTTVEELQITLALDFDLDAPRSFDLVVKAIAKPYHPVREYLEGCYARYGEETISILEGIAERYFGNNKDIAQTQLRKWLIGAARRVFEPGTKLDNVLILHGKQGIQKSSFFRVLSNGWFDDSIGAANDKDERLKLHRNWISEWGELESVFRRKDISAVKSFLTTQIDYLRPPYEKETIAVPRWSAIVGSTNQDEFLADATGNRRFWVVPVKKRIDLELLEQERDQIWAAAVALHFRGEPHWLDLEAEAAAATATAAYENSDPWEGAILDYLDGAGRSETAVEDLLSIVLQIELKDLDRGKQMRVADILKRADWTRTDRREIRNGKRVRIWVRVENCEAEQPAPQPDFEVGDRVELPDGRTGEIVEASESGFAVQNGKPEPERFEVGQLRLAVGTVVLDLRRGELGQIAGHYPDGYRVNGETWSEVLALSEFKVCRPERSQAEG
ncbi:MAG: VapE domain-containing protein, partial [Elainella sp.]